MARTIIPPRSTNRILAALTAEAFELLRPHLRLHTLEFRKIVGRANKPIEQVYFPTRGMLSVVATMMNGDGVEVGQVGNEGASGVLSAFGPVVASSQLMVQAAGEAMRIESDHLATAAESDRSLRRLLVQYHVQFHAQVSQSVACNALHSISQRCCRWLLISQDRIQSDVLPLTHEFLAMMLGVRRVSVTLVLQPLQEHGLVRGGRGTIAILDRRGLEVAACECYARVRENGEPKR